MESIKPLRTRSQPPSGAASQAPRILCWSYSIMAMKEFNPPSRDEFEVRACLVQLHAG